VARPFAVAELGLEALLSPAEVVEAFGWQHARRRPAASAGTPIATEGELAYSTEAMAPTADEDEPAAV
jgi:hypothetical protein